MKKVSETISGMLPLKERNKLNGLLSGKNFDTIVVESCRALSRSVETSEQIFKTAKQNGVNIVSSDIPSLFRVDGNPATNFIRRVMAAVTEFDRDVLVLRLQGGIEQARKKTTRRTTNGLPKVQGRCSILEKHPPTDNQKRRLKEAFKDHRKGCFGWRPLGKKVAQVMRLQSPPAPETCRRLQDALA